MAALHLHARRCILVPGRQPLKIRFTCILIITALGALPLAGQSALKRPGKEYALPPDQVKDSFFAYVIGVIRSGVEMDLTGADLRDILTEFKTSLDLPFNLIAGVSRHGQTNADDADLEIRFNSDVKIPIPFAFLGYHPGSIVASRDLLFSETQPAPSGVPDSVQADEVYVMRLTSGNILVDVDGWIEWLFPSLAQDLIVQVVCIFHSKSLWYCMLSGTGRNTGDAIYQFFDFTNNRIIVPVPQDLRSFGIRIERAWPWMY